MLLAVDLYEYFINVEGVAITLVLTLQSPGIQCAEFDAPEADGLAGDSDATLSEKIFNISVTEIEAVVQPA